VECGGDRRRFSPRARRDRVTLTQSTGRAHPEPWCRSAPRLAPAIPSSSANAGSDHGRRS
jgi:hypothetical protein